MYFPKEMWSQILSFVFQLRYPPEIQQQCKAFVYHTKRSKQSLLNMFVYILLKNIVLNHY